MLVLATLPDHDCNEFIALVQESNCAFTLISFEQWSENAYQPQPEGFIYLRTLPEVIFKRVKSVSLQEIEDKYHQYNDYFITKTTLPQHLREIPLLILNGNIHTKDDFSQFYTHLFSI